MKPYIKVPGMQQYPGGKGGNGTYQNIINLIPPIHTLASLFLGHCAVTRYIKPVQNAILNDIDNNVYNDWIKAKLPEGYRLFNLDAIQILKDKCINTTNLDETGVLLNLDPPYRFEVRKSQADIYRYELRDHSDLLSHIKDFKHAYIIICHYPDPFYDENLKGWNTFDYQSMTRPGLVTERVYMNYDPGSLLHDYKHIGNDFRERERFNRIKNNYLSKLNRLEPVLRNAILCDMISTQGSYRSNMR